MSKLVSVILIYDDQVKVLDGEDKAKPYDDAIKSMSTLWHVHGGTIPDLEWDVHGGTVPDLEKLIAEVVK